MHSGNPHPFLFIVSAHAGWLRILLADDHAVLRRGAREILESHHGWRVVGEAGNGREAVAKAKRLKPDVAIIDISMPDLDGLQVTRQIREAVPTA